MAWVIITRSIAPIPDVENTAGQWRHQIKLQGTQILHGSEMLHFQLKPEIKIIKYNIDRREDGYEEENECRKNRNTTSKSKPSINGSINQSIDRSIEQTGNKSKPIQSCTNNTTSKSSILATSNLRSQKGHLFHRQRLIHQELREYSQQASRLWLPEENRRPSGLSPSPSWSYFTLIGALSVTVRASK